MLDSRCPRSANSPLTVLFGILLNIAVLTTTWAAEPAPPSDPIMAINASRSAIDEQEYLRAVNILEQAVLANPQNAALLLHLGIAYHKSGRNEQALQILEKALALDAQNAEPHYALGVVHLARAAEVSLLKVRGELKGSIEHLERAIELEPDHVAARYYLIQLLINSPRAMGGDQERAKELNARLAELSPLHSTVVKSTLAAKRDEYEQAEQLLLEALDLDPNSTLVHFALLSFYNDRGQHEQAISHGQSFLALPKTWDDTDLASAHFLLADSYWAMAQQQESLRHYAQVLRFTKNPKLIERVQEAVAEMAEQTEKRSEEKS